MRTYIHIIRRPDHILEISVIGVLRSLTLGLIATFTELSLIKLSHDTGVGLLFPPFFERLSSENNSVVI